MTIKEFEKLLKKYRQTATCESEFICDQCTKKCDVLENKLLDAYEWLWERRW